MGINLELPRKLETVTLHYRIPEAGDAWTCRVRATTEGFSTYSSVLLRRGEVPAAKPLSMPLVLKPFCHENGQFGYVPDYPVKSQVYFDPENRPFVGEPNAICSLRDGAWAMADRAEMAGRPEPARYRLRCSKVAFDAAGGVYAFLGAGGELGQVHMPGVVFGLGVGDPDDRLLLAFLDVGAGSLHDGDADHADGKVLVVEHGRAFRFLQCIVLLDRLDESGETARAFENTSNKRRGSCSPVLEILPNQPEINNTAEPEVMST